MTTPNRDERDQSRVDGRAKVAARSVVEGQATIALRDRIALSPEDAAIFTGIASATLKKWRCTGDGPSYVKIGSKIVYLTEDLESFLRARRVA